jgi:hypothetical protein
MFWGENNMSKYQTIQVHEKPVVVAGTCNPTSKETGAGRSRVEGQHKLYNKSLFQKEF